MIAFTAPVASSRTTVLAGNPRLSFSSRGTETSFRDVVSSDEMREGMKSVVWDGEGMESREGVLVWLVEKAWKVFAIRFISESGVRESMMVSTSEEVMMRMLILKAGRWISDSR